MLTVMTVRFFMFRKRFPDFSEGRRRCGFARWRLGLIVSMQSSADYYSVVAVDALMGNRFWAKMEIILSG